MLCMNTHAMIQHLPLVPHQMTGMMLNDINIQINVIIFPEMELHCRTIKIDRYYNYAGRKPIRLCKGPCYNARVMYVF